MAEKRRIELMACAGTGCVSGGAFKIIETLNKELAIEKAAGSAMKDLSQDKAGIHLTPDTGGGTPEGTPAAAA